MTADEILSRDRRFLWHPYTALDDPRVPLVITSALGSRLTTHTGKSLLDGNSSWYVAGLGHRHPRLVNALVNQAQSLPHVALAGITHEPAAALAEELCALSPTGPGRAFFSDDGSTAIEAALKLAVQFFRNSGQPERNRFIALDGAFHGETLGAASLGGIELFRSAFGKLCCDIVHVPSPAPDDDELDVEAAQAIAFRHVARLIERAPQEIAGVIVEPLIQAVSGMRVYAPGYLAELRRLTAAHGILLIVDEVFTGLGRTGSFWACDQAPLASAPDLVCVGKTFSGGLLPFAATLVAEHVCEAFRGGKERAFLHGHSYCGNPLGAAVAREVLAVMRDEDVLGQVGKKAHLLRAAVQEVERRGGRRARSLGMCAAVDLDGGGYLGGAGWRAYEAALRFGAYLRPLGDTFYMTPPLTIPESDLKELCSIFVEAASEALR